MKISSLISAAEKTWLRDDSFDIWITESNAIIDLGPDRTHLCYLSEMSLSQAELFKAGWIKITNTRSKIWIEGLEQTLRSKKRIWALPLINDHKLIDIVVKSEVYEELLSMPKDIRKFINLL